MQTQLKETYEVIAEKILTALKGETREWLVKRIKEYAETIEPVNGNLIVKVRLMNFNYAYLSRKMNGYMDWKEYELDAIGKILNIEF